MAKRGRGAANAGPVRIQRLDHRNAATARQIHGVWMAAYEQEARLLGVSTFPPLGRSVEDLMGDGDCFLGAFNQGVLAGALAFAPDDEPGQFIVNTLVVHPDHQRRGLARALMAEALRLGGAHPFAVATAAANAPALALYRSLGFVVYRQGTIGPEALALVKLRRPATDDGEGDGAPGAG